MAATSALAGPSPSLPPERSPPVVVAVRAGGGGEWAGFTCVFARCDFLGSLGRGYFGGGSREAGGRPRRWVVSQQTSGLMYLWPTVE